MEPKDEPKNLLKKEKSEEKTITKKTSSDKSEENTINNIKSLSNNQFDKLELNNEHFQILQQKEQKEENDEDEFNRQDILNKHKALSDKDIVNIKNNIEKNNSQTQLKEIKETYKKSRSQVILKPIINIIIEMMIIVRMSLHYLIIIKTSI